MATGNVWRPQGGDELRVDSGGTITNAGTQASNVADASAPTAYSAHASGATTVTSNAATDLDSTAAALATLRGEVATLTTKFNSVLAALEGVGIMASS